MDRELSTAPGAHQPGNSQNPALLLLLLRLQHLPAALKLGVILWSKHWDNSHTKNYKKDHFPSKIYCKEIMQQRHEARCNLHLIDNIISNNLEVFLKKDRHLETVSQNNVETGARK